MGTHRLASSLLAALTACAAGACGKAPVATEAVRPPDRAVDRDARSAPAVLPPAPADPPISLRPPGPGQRATLLELHMAERYADLRQIERALVEGELTDVREYATALAFDRSDPELAPWGEHLARMREAAMALSSATDVAAACRREPALAATCGGCHLETGAQPRFADDAPPVDDGTAPVRMARHQWAADRLWQALIAPSTAAWRDGLEVLAATPLPAGELAPDAAFDTRGRIGELGRDLRTSAQRARKVDGLRRRAEAYGEILVTCAGCHALVH